MCDNAAPILRLNQPSKPLRLAETKQPSEPARPDRAGGGTRSVPITYSRCSGVQCEQGVPKGTTVLVSTDLPKFCAASPKIRSAPLNLRGAHCDSAAASQRPDPGADVGPVPAQMWPVGPGVDVGRSRSRCGALRGSQSRRSVAIAQMCAGSRRSVKWVGWVGDWMRAARARQLARMLARQPR
jgi:hypothetical protein